MYGPFLIWVGFGGTFVRVLPAPNPKPRNPTPPEAPKTSNPKTPKPKTLSPTSQTQSLQPYPGVQEEVVIEHTEVQDDLLRCLDVWAAGVL